MSFNPNFPIPYTQNVSIYSLPATQTTLLPYPCTPEQQIQETAWSLRLRPWSLPVFAPYRPLQIDWAALPPTLDALVHSIAAATGWPPEAILLAILGCISIASHGRFRFRLDRDWIEMIRLYIAICASSGTRKSEIVEKLKAPFIRFEDMRNSTLAGMRMVAEFKRKSQKAALCFASKQSIKNAWRDAQNHDSGCDIPKFFENVSAQAEEIIRHVPATQEPIALFVNGFSNKKLLALMERQGGTAAIFEAEGQSLLNALNSASAANLELFLKGYTGEACSEQNMHREVYVRTPTLNLLFFCQPESMAHMYKSEIFNRVGLTARFLPYFAGCIMPSDGSAITGLDEYGAKMENMLNRYYSQDTDREVFTLEPTTEAYQAVKDFENESMNVSWGEGSEQAESFKHKLHGTAARIAALIHIWRHDEPEKHRVSLQDMRSGIFIAIMSVDHARYAFSPTGIGAYYDAMKIIDWIRRSGQQRFTPRDICQALSGMKRENVYPALDLLEQYDIIGQCHIPSGKHKCVVHPNFR